VSSSGGGLPGRLDLDRDRGARYLERLLTVDVPMGADQLVEMVKLTVILAWVSTASLPW